MKKKTIKGKMMVCQVMGTQADGKIHMLVGKDDHVFNLEDGDKFFTAVFTKDPFEDE